jgi:hypothetical protein
MARKVPSIGAGAIDSHVFGGKAFHHCKVNMLSFNCISPMFLAHRLLVPAGRARTSTSSAFLGLVYPLVMEFMGIPINSISGALNLEIYAEGLLAFP